MTKWDCIHKISEQGARLRIDAILKLLEWCDKPNTASVTLDEAERFLELLNQTEASEQSDADAR